MNQIKTPALGGTFVEDVSILWGEHRPDLIDEAVLSDLFLATASATPDRVAMVEGERRLTYAEVERASARIAQELGRRGVGVGAVVGLWLPRGVDALIAQIAVTRTGAAFLPFDAEAPADRVAQCLADAEAALLVTGETGKTRLSDPPCLVATFGELELGDDDVVFPSRPQGLTADHPAYLIYTSGSTGTPKGIVVSHRNIVHFLRAANERYGLIGADVVFQGASLAFDLSMEEIWIPYMVGARLVVATPQAIGETDKLAAHLAAEGVTVLDTVPTLLSLLSEDIPSLRVIILGGEACPPAVVSRWARDGRTLFNSYGPTEATVVATLAAIEPGETVTIGGPIPNYSCYVVDPETLAVLPVDREGELLIGGPGVAQGYLNRPDLTAQKFIPNPFPSTGEDPILYRSGDAVSMDGEGRIHFHGRIDDQVKIRGFRVELGEIEARILAEGGVSHAATLLRKEDGLDLLVAFVTPSGDAAFDPGDLRRALARTLPAYMVPQRIETLAAMPRLASGKIDRNALKARPLTPVAAVDHEQPRSAAEAHLAAAAASVFPGQPIPLEADFFTDMGGHSLIAARFLGAVRADARYGALTLQDVYGLRTLRAMASALETRGAGVARDLSFTPPPLMRRFLCGLAQALTLPLILFLTAAQWLGVFVTFLLIDADTLGPVGQLFALLGVYVALTVGTGLVGVAGKWLVIGRTKPGVYPLWGAYHYRLWVAAKLASLVKVKWLQGTPVMRVFLRLMGSKVGKDALISDFDAGAMDLLIFGDRVVTGAKTKYANVEAIGNELHVGRIVIEDDAYVGTSVVLGHDVTIGRGAEIGDLTAVLPGATIPAFEIWGGSPARKTGALDPAAIEPFVSASPARKGVMSALYVLCLLVIPPIGLLPIFPAFWLFDHVDLVISGVTKADTMAYLPLLTWPTAMALIVLTVALVVALRWIIMPTRLKEGRYSIHSWTYFRKWMLGLTTEVKLETLSSLFATVYMRLWYRLMGARIGKGSELSTNLNGRFDLVSIGAKNFIADEVILGDEEIRRGWMILKRVETGDRVFVGNDAVVPPGTRIADDALLGIKSLPPDSLQIGKGETWFGSPAIRLPTRQKVEAAANWTFEPSLGRRIARASFEAMHTSIPTMLFITFGYWTVTYMEPFIDEGRYFAVFAIFLTASCLIPFAMTLVTAALKWGMMGVYRPTMKPMWSFWAMRTEAVAVLYWGLAGKVFLEPLRATPFLPWVLRLYGTKTGKGIYMDSTDLTEFDCVTIGDYCTINPMSALQTHLYEDRIMKVGRVDLGKGVSVGAGATVLYDTKLGDYARLGPLTVVMKGETIPAHTSWVGAPAEPAAA